ncbi:MAG: hypothetical protein ACQEQI_07555, partial [Bacillota bacterium]
EELKEIDINATSVNKNILLEGKRKNDQIRFGYEKDKSGVVYGYAISINNEEKITLLDEAKKRGGNKVDSIEDFSELEEGVYPLYWGKSELVFGRLNAHLNGHKSNGNLHLCDYDFFEGKKIFYAVLIVSDNKAFENHLINQFTPILKTYKS